MKIQSANIVWLLYMHGNMDFYRLCGGALERKTAKLFWRNKRERSDELVSQIQNRFWSSTREHFFRPFSRFLNPHRDLFVINFVFCHLRRNGSFSVSWRNTQSAYTYLPTYHSQSPTRECLVSKNRLKQVKNKNIVRL